MKNKLIALLLCLAVIFSFTGCSNEDKQYIKDVESIVKIMDDNMATGEYTLYGKDKELYDKFLTKYKDKDLNGRIVAMATTVYRYTNSNEVDQIKYNLEEDYNKFKDYLIKAKNDYEMIQKLKKEVKEDNK